MNTLQKTLLAKRPLAIESIFRFRPMMRWIVGVKAKDTFGAVHSTQPPAHPACAWRGLCEALRMQTYNFVARSTASRPYFSNHDFARWFWIEMKVRFPNARAVILMPNHLHLVIDTPHEKFIRGQLSELLRIASIRFRLGIRAWEQVPEGRIVADHKHLLRLIRYVYLNPCRAKLVRDPLQWTYSTFRESLGLRLDHWPNIQKSLRDLGYSEGADLVRFHRYVSQDAHAAEYKPVITTQTNDLSKWGATVARDAAQAMHAAYDLKLPRHAKSHVMWLLQDQGHRDHQIFRTVLGVRSTQIWTLKNSPPPPIRVQRLLRTYLADERLRWEVMQNRN